MLPKIFDFMDYFVRSVEEKPDDDEEEVSSQLYDDGWTMYGDDYSGEDEYSQADESEEEEAILIGPNDEEATGYGVVRGQLVPTSGNTLVETDAPWDRDVELIEDIEIRADKLINARKAL